jgi:uncharacterized circularly permuted ATP-grasp superfamily protein
MIRDVIDRYHDLLTEQLAADAEGAMNEAQRARRVYFGDRPLCTVLRPHFYEPHHWEYLKRQTETLLGAFRRAHRAAMADAGVRRQLYLEAYEEALFSLDIGFEVPWTTSRLDSFYDMDSGRLSFVEYNAETPAGMAYEDELADVFPDLEPMRLFDRHYAIRSFMVSQGLVQSLFEVYRQWGGAGRPQIGIIDWGDVPTLNEHLLCQEKLEREGAPTVLADPRALEYRDGHLYAGDFRIDLIYKRVLCSELIERMGIDNPIVHALRDRAVAMSNAFSAKLMAKKASFALLSDERNAHLFTPEQHQSIAAHIPWTRIVEERKTLFHGLSIDLIPFIAENRNRFVLKPNDEYGGKGVIIGWECTDAVWAETLRTAESVPYVVQERVDAAYEDFPSRITGALEISPRLVDADPFIFFGRTTSGCMTRLSTTTLLNVTAGGGSIAPTFIVYKRT